MPVFILASPMSPTYPFYQKTKIAPTYQLIKYSCLIKGHKYTVQSHKSIEMQHTFLILKILV